MLTPNTGEDIEQHRTPLIADENAKWYSNFRRHFGNFLITKYTLTI